MVIADRYVAAGQAAHWDGKTETGEPVGSGTYLLHALTQKNHETELAKIEGRGFLQRLKTVFSG